MCGKGTLLWKSQLDYFLSCFSSFQVFKFSSFQVFELCFFFAFIPFPPLFPLLFSLLSSLTPLTFSPLPLAYATLCLLADRLLCRAD